jgi:predicted acetyltransferase
MRGFSLRPIRAGEVEAVRRLVQLYIYDLGGAHWDVQPNGMFAPPDWHRRFWSGRGRQLFVLRVHGRLAGFAMVRDRAHFAGRATREIAEFFVLRKYRRRGVGTRAAAELFRRFPGRWELAELSWNVAAQRFWRRVIRRLGAGGITERRRRLDDLVMVVQHFDIARPRGRRVARPASRARRRSA